MNSTPRGAPAPSYRECLLPSVARTPSVTQVTPAKKITFLKRGDPRFSGVRLAVHQRTFKSFGVLMDELSQRVPLSFGVRSVTTPRGLHGLSALEQLEDGGCYLCSDKKPPKTSGGPGWPQGKGPSAQQSQDVEGQCEAPETSSSQKNPQALRKIMLVKNGDPRFQQTVVLSQRNTRSLAAFLSKASDLLHFPVKQVFTPSGKKVDSVKALRHSPSVLVCAGHESFRPPAMEGTTRGGTEALSGQASRIKNGNWGPKAKQSTIHSRSRSDSRTRQFSLLLERSGPSDPLASLHHGWMGPAPDRHPQDTPAQLGPLVAGDNVEKTVHMNEDGSLSVEMKVHFHLLGNDMLLRSKRVGRASASTAAGGEGPAPGEADPVHCVCEGHSGGCSEPRALGLRAQEAGCKEVFERGRWQPGSQYEIWTNPLYSAQGVGTASWRRPGLTQHSHPRGLWTQGVASKKRSSKDSVSPASSDRPPDGSEPGSSCCSGSPEGSEGGCGPQPATGAASQRGFGWEASSTPQAGEGPGPEGAMLGSRGHRCLTPRTRGVAGAPSVSAASQAGPSEWGKQHQGGPSTARPMMSPQKSTHRERPCSSATNLLSLRNKDLQAEGGEQATRHPQGRDGSGARLPPASGHFGSGDTAEVCFPPSTCTSATGRRRKKSRASTVSSLSMSGLDQEAQRGRPRQRRSRTDTHCLLSSPVSGQTRGPPSTGRGCHADPAPRLSGSSSSARNQASGDPGPPSSASLHSQDIQGVSSASITPVSNSDCASDFYPPYSPSPETEGKTKFRADSLTNTSDSLGSHADGLGEEAGGSVPKPFGPLLLPAGQHERGKPGAPQGSCYSQMGTSRVCRSPGGEMQALQASRPRGSQGPSSVACTVCSRYCPTPPRAQRSGKKHPSCSSSDHCADWGPGRGEPGEEQLDVQCPRPSSPQSGDRGRAARAARRGSPSLGPRPGRKFQGQAAGEGEGRKEQKDNGSETPSALPRASPEAVVREWLSNIPEEPVPMKCEMVDDSMDVAGGGLKGPTEDPGDKHPPEGLGEPAQARRPSLEKAISKNEPEGALPVTGDTGPQSGEGLPHSGVSKVPKEAGAGEGAVGDCGEGQCVLPCRLSASIEIMKALMGSKQGRPSSLPEVSGPVGQRLSHSAQALVTCLARLHFFDEDFGSPTGKARFTDSPRYQELLGTFRTLWPGCGLRQGELDPGLRESGRCQALPGLGSHAVTEDFTPTSSSGVDVGSGSGGSGEGSGPCAVDRAPVSEKTELPLKISTQRPGSRTSENPEGLGNQEQGGSTASSSSQALACAPREDEAEGRSGEQTLGCRLDQVVENTVQEEAEQLEKMKEEKERAGLTGEAVSGFPEEERTAGRESSGAGPQGGEGARGAEEAGADPASAPPPPPERTESRTETLGSLPERDSDVSGSPSGPSADPGSEKLPAAAEVAHTQAPAQFTQGAGERGPAGAHRVALDPDPLWVSGLLTKMEKAFLAHLAGAVADLRARWGLQSDDLLDLLVAELQQDVAQRLQDSTEKELRKIQSRAGSRVPGPPRAARRWETSLPTAQRRSRLRGLRNLSAFSDQARAPSTFSFSLEDRPKVRAALEARLGREAEGEEFCPCEACARKSVVPAAPKDTVGTASAPIKEAFDLWQILKKEKRKCANEEMTGTDPEKTRMELLQRDPSGTRTVQESDGGLELGLGQDPGSEAGDEDEGSQTLGRGEGPGGGGGEQAAAAPQRGGGSTEPHAGHPPEQGMGDKEESTAEGSGAEVSVESGVLGGADGSPGGQNEGANCTEVQQTEGEGQSESGRGSQGEKEGSPQAGPRQGQSGEVSGHSSPDQEGRPTPPPAPGGDTPSQRSGPETAPSSSRTSSLGNCSQLSQKGSKEEPSSGDTRTSGDEPNGAPGSESKVTGRYPESSTSEEEGPCSGSRPPERGTDEGLSPEPRADQGSALDDEKVVKSLSGTETSFKGLVMDQIDGLGQDDLDF
ncbi:retinitis pigmentosa 1-like 1 protein [Saccopteryx leptura]|uniref:retinitis pigmentosa 1-like 1 protein n=1 Tax=Saccopteryx leptura TaxID=249018 RepID=UPI00339CB792